MRLVQSETKGIVFPEQTRSNRRTPPSIIPDVQSIRLLRERRSRIGLIVRVDIPGHGCCVTRDNTVGGTDWVSVAVVANGRHGEMLRRGEEICEVPGKRDDVARSDLVVRGSSLRGLGDSETTGGGSLWNRALA